MEFIEIFSGFAILFVGILAIIGLSASFQESYGTNLVGTGVFNDALTNAQLNLTTGFVKKGLTYGNSTIAGEGQGTSTNQGDNLIIRAWNSITLMNELIGITPALIQDAGAALNIPSIYLQIASAVFWTVFALTLAYLLIIGGRRLLGV